MVITELGAQKTRLIEVGGQIFNPAPSHKTPLSPPSPLPFQLHADAFLLVHSETA